MIKTRIKAVVLLLIGIGLGFVSNYWQTNGEKPFQLGLDLSGGSYLVYRADVSAIAEGEVKDAMESVRDVVERRVNLFGVGEPVVRTGTSSLGGDGVEQRLTVELPGVTDLKEATEMIGQTPLLEFKTEQTEEKRNEIIAARALQNAEAGIVPDEEGDYSEEDQALLLDFEYTGVADEDPFYADTELTGRFVKGANLQFQQGGHGGAMAGTPIVGLNFDKEGAELFEQITEENIGRTVAIYLDGYPISTPTVQAKITGGEAIITGQFTPEEAKQLVGRINSGALPVPIELIATQSIGPSLGQSATDAGVMAGIIGILVVMAYMIIWYRLPGVLAALSLGLYGVLMLVLFQLIPVTLTAAGIAGFIISLGIAVDANILIFERLKEEMRAGRTVRDAAHTGFKRAWTSIRDANLSSIISAVILFWFGTSLIKGFALTFGLGVIVSMLTAIIATRIFLYATTGYANSKAMRWLHGTGFDKVN